MQTHLRLLALAIALLIVSPAYGQGTFRNLDFEFATPFPVPIPGDPYGRVQFSQAFPGWTGYVGGVQETAALYNNAFLDSSGIGIINSSVSISFLGDVARHVNGNFTALLQAGVRLNVFPLQPADTTLAQSGLIPAGTQSLLFNAYTYSPGTFGVTLGGQMLSLIPIQSDANSTLYGADIHAWAGQTAELAFTLFAMDPHFVNRYLYLDSIQFSNQPIPEPSVFGLFAIGALLLGWRSLEKRKP